MSKFYYKDGTTSSIYDNSKVLHRTDGPAAEYGSGTKAWYIDGKQHRIDGPAVEYPYGAKRWYVDGEHYTKEDFNQLIEEIRQLPKVLRLIYPREWVRNYEEK